MTYKLARKKSIQRLLYSFLIVILFVFWFYIYFRGIFPRFPYIRDGLLFSIAGLTIIDLLLLNKPLSPNKIDIAVFILFSYLMFELVFTVLRTGSLEAAYHGFRIDFLPIVLYFAFSRLRIDIYRKSFHRFFLIFLILGSISTIIEFILIYTGIVSQNFFLELLRVSEIRRGATIGDIQRIFGVAGSPHITGIYNLMTLALLLFIPLSVLKQRLQLSLKSAKFLGSKFILLIAITSVFCSTSRTAWMIMIFIMMLAFIIRKQSITKSFFVVIICLVFFDFFIFRQSDIGRESMINQICGMVKFFEINILEFTKDAFNSSPIIGFGYGISNSLALSDNISSQNLTLQCDIYFAELFRMTGIIGASLFAIIFIMIPILFLLSKHRSQEIKGYALCILVVGISFGHYSPLTPPIVSLSVWYLLSVLSWDGSEKLKLAKSYYPSNSPKFKAVMPEKAWHQC